VYFDRDRSRHSLRNSAAAFGDAGPALPEFKEQTQGTLTARLNRQAEHTRKGGTDVRSALRYTAGFSS
jgi:hypothetical protein